MRKKDSRIKSEDLTLKLTRTSNAYDKDDLGVKSVGGAMVEFDMQPDRSLGDCHLAAIDLDWEHHLQKVEKPNTTRAKRFYWQEMARKSCQR